jgi:hypothetical protein
MPNRFPGLIRPPRNNSKKERQLEIAIAIAMILLSLASRDATRTHPTHIALLAEFFS